jgi:signal peptidase I
VSDGGYPVPATEVPAADNQQATQGKSARSAQAASHGWAAAVQSLAITVAIAIFVITFIVQAFQIPSESMENTLLIGDYLLVDKVHYGHGGIWGHIEPYEPIRRGEIIVFRYPVDPTQHFVKRVIGVPGDHIRMRNKQVYVNGVRLKEPYAVYRSAVPDAYRDDFPAPGYISANVEARWWVEMRRVVNNGELVVPPNDYFVLGDNRDESLDSRYWGFVPRANIIGRPLVIYWSFRDADDETARAANDKLNHLEAAFLRLFHDTRWDRTFHLVR